jgi:two-component system, NarL family, nitrate/nitrite response regulator NarL
MKVRVLVVSDVRVVQEGLRLLLARHEPLEVVSVADTRHAREQAEHVQPDVVLFDAARCGAERAKEFVAGLPRSRVVAFGVKETGEEILALAAAGTAGYVRDSAEGGDVVKVLERVMCDELPCSARAAALLYREVAKLSGGPDERAHPGARASTGGARPCAAPLSRREFEVAHLVDRGLSNKEIARRLGIEAATVKNHVHRMCEKLNVHRRGEAIARIRSLLRAQNSVQPRSSPLPASAPELSSPALDAS